MYAGVKSSSINTLSYLKTYKLGCGKHPETGEALHWLKKEYYDGTKDYMAEILADKTTKEVVCLNTREIFPNVEQAAVYAGVKPRTIFNVSFPSKYKLGCGKHPETGERLYWLKKKHYDESKDYMAKIIADKTKKEIVCLNTGEVFPNAEQAAVYVGVKTLTLYNHSFPSSYTTGCGEHPETGEKLYWLRRKFYDESKDYINELKTIEERESVVCLNTREVFNNPKAASESYNINDPSEIVRNSTINRCHKSVGNHPVTKQGLHWLRERFYNPNADYSYLFR